MQVYIDSKGSSSSEQEKASTYLNMILFLVIHLTSCFLRELDQIIILCFILDTFRLISLECNPYLQKNIAHSSHWKGTPK